MTGRVLILGGARSGKSSYAERLLADAEDVDYAACGPPADPGDPEWAERVHTHQARRPAHWQTYETTDLPGLLSAGSGPPLLIDCLGTWLTRVMDSTEAWHNPGVPALTERVEVLVEAWRRTARHVVAVSNEAGSGVVPATLAGRRFRDELGGLNAAIAAEADEVILMTAGIAQRLK